MVISEILEDILKCGNNSWKYGKYGCKWWILSNSFMILLNDHYFGNNSNYVVQTYGQLQSNSQSKLVDIVHNCN